ncbi:hypothetical protein L484_010306 [Morus notabilis]|uniref:F-box associated domain-containing protein n=1 Tax=Morus notabilis TaxID=981085 RepID=W9QNC5_9ROSA|nr:hypothetical protein L484_010306 [Morus notabilis]
MGPYCGRNPAKTATQIAGQVQVRLQTLEFSHLKPKLRPNLSPVFQCASSTERHFIYFRLRGTQFTKLEHAPTTASYLWPVGSSNGITCFVIVSTYNHEYRSKCITILWNPSIHEHPLEIRPPPLGPESMVQPEFCAAIGHDPRTGDYKVVLVNYGRGEPLAHVYALKSQRWKQIDIDENVDAKLRCDRVKIDRWPVFG